MMLQRVELCTSVFHHEHTTIVDIESLIELSLVASLGFAQDGELLAIGRRDGTIRMWDLVRDASAGLVWDGRGGATGESYYDESTESIWLGSAGLLLQIPLNPDRWIERACEIVGRDFTQDEWDRFVPGDEPLSSACSPGGSQSDADTPTSTAASAGRITIEGEVEFTNTGAVGTFEVTDGSEILGCEHGTHTEMGPVSGVDKVMTCSSGSRSGTFTITFLPREGTWIVRKATGDFAGLTGHGVWSALENTNRDRQTDLLVGEVTFTEQPTP